ncbi:threonine ammonia-lyase IlvA [Dietzia sp. CQ4]|nr:MULTISPECIES: threonine ammonia-lyase IlvA [Dietzia]MBB1034776.1 threonine ammonia-lyase IlvA [Dietzia sp. CQ4]MBB1041336.1 threonine ammonia-lyase IlvA [Dietzia sp. Cai40]MBB1043262.1 threonine ammonia-lyase IlvA [Dietzia sp. DQ11-44]MBB1047250.1 threonine ammonia-lyase IlvA [Dietzia cercidiphylli]MBB1050001.1 threonine ammonia-lyase IlvA [Dietzia sp. CW19]
MVVVTVTDSAATQVVTPDDIDIAARRIGDVILASELHQSERLSEQTGATILLKREDQQAVRSYKIRGAYNLMSQLTGDERSAGVVTASAGNHAQGVAFACRSLGINGRIYVPTNTPKQKRDRILAHGRNWVELVVTGVNFDAAQTAARADAERTGATMVPPFDHPDTMAGQGTIAAEILAQLDRVPDAVVVPVGGGGLVGGLATYLAEYAPDCKIIAVEPAGAPSLTRALEAGEPVTLDTVDTFVDGASVARLGDFPFGVISSMTERIQVLTVDEGAVCTAMLELYQNEGIISEPAGALAVTALEQLEIDEGATVVCIISGGNNDVSRYSEIIERSLVHQGLKHYFLVKFPQEPGQLRRFLDEVLGPEDDITQFEYLKRNNREYGAALVGIELGSATGLHSLLERMEASRIDCERLEPGTAAYEYLT